MAPRAVLKVKSKYLLICNICIFYATRVIKFWFLLPRLTFFYFPICAVFFSFVSPEVRVVLLRLLLQGEGDGEVEYPDGGG